MSTFEFKHWSVAGQQSARLLNPRITCTIDGLPLYVARDDKRRMLHKRCNLGIGRSKR